MFDLHLKKKNKSITFVVNNCQSYVQVSLVCDFGGITFLIRPSFEMILEGMTLQKKTKGT